MNATEHGLAAVEQRDERAPERDAGDEGLGAVDGIEHPDKLGVGAVIAEFFADEAVTREFFRNEPAHEFLGAAVGDRDRRGVALGLDRERAVAEVRTDKLAARAGELGHERAMGIQLHDQLAVRESRE